MGREQETTCGPVVARAELMFEQQSWITSHSLQCVYWNVDITAVYSIDFIYSKFIIINQNIIPEQFSMFKCYAR